MAHPLPRKTGDRPRDLDRAWEAGDPIPAPEVLHEDGDAAWALWNQVARQHEAGFAPTAPMTLPPNLSSEQLGWARTLPAAGAPSLRAPARQTQPLFTLETALLVSRRNNRVCPRPERWNAFSELLPARKTLRGTQQPPTAATGAAWTVTPSLTKRLFFREQLEWADRAGVLETAIAFMQSMAEEDWLHMGEA